MLPGDAIDAASTGSAGSRRLALDGIMNKQSLVAVCFLTIASCATDRATGPQDSAAFTFDATVAIGSGIAAVSYQGSSYLSGDAVVVHATYPDYESAIAARDIHLELSFASGTDDFVLLPSCGEAYGEPISERDEDRIDVLSGETAPSFGGQGSCSTASMDYGWTN